MTATMTTYSQIQRNNDKEAIKDRTKTELAIIAIYAAAYADIKALIKDIDSNKFNIIELRKYGKIEKLDNKFAEIISTANSKIDKLVKGDLKSSYIKAYETITNSFEEATKISISTVRLPESAVNYLQTNDKWLDLLKSNNGSLLSDTQYLFEQNLRLNARQEVIYGLLKGKSQTSVAKAIRERFETSASRSRAIARTEMHSAQMVGRLDGIDRASEAALKLGLDPMKVWRHNNKPTLSSGRKYTPRLDHIAMDGKEADKNGVFTMLDGVQTTAPGLTGEAYHDINCECSVEFRLNGLDKLQT